MVKAGCLHLVQPIVEGLVIYVAGCAVVVSRQVLVARHLAVGCRLQRVACLLCVASANLVIDIAVVIVDCVVRNDVHVVVCAHVGDRVFSLV